MAAKGSAASSHRDAPDTAFRSQLHQGMAGPYLGEMFFKWVRGHGEVARERDLFCWLYDEAAGPAAPSSVGWPMAGLNWPGASLRYHASRAGFTSARQTH